MSAAARTVNDSIWRVPIRTPVARSTACPAWANEPRVASTAASRRSPWECFSTGRMQISMPGLPVGDPPDDDLTDHGGQRPVPAGLGAPPHHPVGVDNLRQPRFPCRAQVVVFLQALGPPGGNGSTPAPPPRRG